MRKPKMLLFRVTEDEFREFKAVCDDLDESKVLRALTRIFLGDAKLQTRVFSEAKRK